MISSIDPLLIEAQKFEENLIYKLIYKVADKVSRFYKLSTYKYNKDNKDKMKQLLAKTWYYRGSMLGKTSKNFK